MAWTAMFQTLGGGRMLFIGAAIMLAIVGCSRALRRSSLEVHKRGVVLVEGTQRRRQTRRSRTTYAGVLTLVGCDVPFLDETKHFKLIGTTGTGKSTAIRELLAGALARGDRAVVADPDGGYRDRFFSRYRGDVILNPFEPQSVMWDPFAEITDAYDIDQLSAGLIPSTDDASSNEWRGYARTFLTAVLRRCRQEKRRSVGELWRLVAVASSEELRLIVADTPAQPFLDPENARMFGSIRSVAVSAIAALEYVQAQRSASFSVREWVRAKGNTGALFIPYKGAQIAALRSMIATWMRLAIFEAMNGAENHDRRLWFVVDELDALGAIEGLKDALARLRKFGGRCVLGFQSIAQVSGTYGAAEAQTIVENCGTTLILRCSGSENGGTSQFASRLIGEREVIRRQTSRGSDREGGFAVRGVRRSKNVSEQHVTEMAVMASQIEQLPDLCGYLKSASSPEWRKVSFGTGQSAFRRFG
ncbi:MAG TPA: type IV secretion system DNA-binding domain-containing protein [Steroidobacteraceae bacterium]|nr:type IV secretion system DNA-binding domain-containing protein [Steroidobacteraceae bacterium]